jgi:hypothetical protein
LPGTSRSVHRRTEDRCGPLFDQACSSSLTSGYR